MNIPASVFSPADPCRGGRHEDDGRLSVTDDKGFSMGIFDHVVNATWQNRIAIDASLGIDPGPPWVHRYKLALHLADAPVIPGLPSCTFILGPPFTHRL